MNVLLAKKTVEQIVAELKEQRKFDDEEVLKHLKSSGITTSSEMLDVINAMLEHEPYFNFFIGKNFVNYAEASEKFFDLIVRLSRIDRFGYDVSSLGKLYQSDPETASFLYEKLRKIDEYKIAMTIGYLLGGMGPAKLDCLYKIIDSNENPTVNEEISYACALYRTASEKKIPKRFLDLLISYANADDKNLRHHAIGTLMIWFNETKRIQKFLISYARQNDENKSLVLRNVTPIIRRNEEFCARILKTCSNTNDQNLIHGIGLDLGYIAPQRPIEVLTILKKWCRKQGFHLGQWPKWAAGEAGKGDIDKIEKFLLDWIMAERNGITMQFHLPHLIDEVYKGKDDALIKLLSQINYKEKKKARLIVKTLQEVLSEGFGNVGRSESFLNSCNAILMKIANNQELEINVDSEIENPVIKTLALVDAVDHGRKKMDPSEVKKNLKYFPNIVSFFEKKRLDKLIEQKPAHPFVKILSRVPVSDNHVKRVLKRIDKQDEPWKQGWMIHAVKSRFYPASIMQDMDASLSMLGKNEQGIARLRDGMLDENDFFSTLIELNFYARFKKKYPTQLQPSVDNNKLDAEVIIDDIRCLFEIYTPKEDIRLKYVRTVHSMKNKTKKSILAKLEKQLKAADGLGHPVILIIDNSIGLSVDEIEIADSLFGTYQWTLMMDKEKGEVVKEYGTRKKDSISEVSQYGKVISAVVLLKREMDDTDLKVKLYGKIFPNPSATVPLTEELTKKIENTLLGQPVY